MSHERRKRTDFMTTKKKRKLEVKSKRKPSSLALAHGSAPRIVQLLMTPNDARWQGTLLGLSSDGETYHCNSGYWEPYVPKLGVLPNNPDDTRGK
jgi:hypothetical protein